jgi:AAA domain
LMAPERGSGMLENLDDELARARARVAAAKRLNEEADKRFIAKPFVIRPPSEIPPRGKLFAGHYYRKLLSATVGPPGIGKTSLQLIESVGMAAGRDLLTGDKLKKPLRVWYWNLEDPYEELERRVAAIVLHYGLTQADIGWRLFINSSHDQELVIGERGKDGNLICQPTVTALIFECKKRRIDVLIADPFVSLHRVPENDNTAIDMVAKAWGSIGSACNCSTELAIHVRKLQTGISEFTDDDARGASAQKGAARIMRVVNAMSKTDAEKFDVPEKERGYYFNVGEGKGNVRPNENNIYWCKFKSVCLGNHTDDLPDDKIGVPCSWKPPGLFDCMDSVRKLAQIQRLISQGVWRADVRAQNWAGKAVAEVLGRPTDTSGARKKISEMLKVWIENKVFKIVSRKDEHRVFREFIEVGEIVTE